LAVFYHSTIGEDWDTLPIVSESPFLSDVDECNWFGITCIVVGDEECVQRIIFEANGLSGTM